MFINEKVVFIGKNEMEVEALCNWLIDISGISYKTRRYLDRYLLVANNEVEYYIGILLGNVIAANFYYDVKWIDASDKINEVDNIHICTVNLNRQNENEENIQKVIGEFASKLSYSIGDVPVTIKYEELGEMYKVYIRLTEVYTNALNKNSYGKFLQVMSDLQNKLKKFTKEYVFPEEYMLKDKTFDEITCFDFDGSAMLIDTQAEKMQKNMLMSYFWKSSLILGIIAPEGLNLAPKEEEKNFPKIDEEYSRSSCRYSTELGSIEKLERKEDIITFYFNASTHFEEEYNSNGKNETFWEIPEKFEMNDKLKIKGKIEVLENSKLVITSDVFVTRKVKGKKLCSKSTVYDKLYQNKDYVDTTFSFSVTDYFEIIDLDLLLHYTDASKFYETYQIPIGFKFGYSLMAEEDNSKVVYDDNEQDWICYGDISEVKKYLIKKEK